MTTNKKNTKKNSAARKLIPAVGMLTASAMMLASSTYAWFTMSREVEVNNIKMTATVPEDIQISLGHININGITAANASTKTGLVDNEGVLAPASDAQDATADDGGVKAPETGSDAYAMLDWSSSADISQYYRMGKLIPASSTTGLNIFFTPDANGVGKTLKTDPMYYQAASGLTAIGEDEYDSTNKTWSNSASKNYRTTLHAIDDETEANDYWNDGETADITKNKYVTASAWNVTNDDGYYVDIPVWLRTSSTTAPTLAVDAYVTANKAVDDDDLYLAARAAIIYETATPGEGAEYTSENPTTAGSTGLIEVRKDTWKGDSIVNFMSSTNATGEAVNGLTGAVVRDNGKAASYTTEKHYDGTQKIHLNAGTGGEYSTPVKAIIRVWLEGEDPNCWNQNAGQDFNISIKFTRDEVTEATLPDGQTAFSNDTNGNVLNKGMIAYVTVDQSATSKSNDVLVFAYDGASWQLRDGTYHVYDGYEYKISSTAMGDTNAIISYLNTSVVTGADAAATVTTPGTITITASAKS